MRAFERALLVVILLLGLWLRWGLNGTWRLEPDEALYSTWARNVASGADVWLAHTAGVDKPPLLIYTIALSMNVYGFFEFASRFPSIVASTVAILLTYLLALRLYKTRPVALLAALLAALSPFAVLYAPTAYADPLMVLWLLLAATLAAYDHWGWAGVAAALAVLTKQEAPLLLPIVLMFGWRTLLPARLLAGADGAKAWQYATGNRLISMAVMFAMVAGGVELLWESQRPGQPSPFALGLSHYGGIGLVAAGDILPRLAGWWDEALRWVFASPLLNVAMVAMLALLAWRTVRQRWMGDAGKGHQATGPGAGKNARPTVDADQVLLQAIVYCVLARTLVSFQMWNRYLLPAVPLLCIALARGADLVWQSILRVLAGRRVILPGLAQLLLPILLAGALMVAPLSDALAGRIHVGSDHGKYSGIETTSLYVRENVAPGSVIYHQSLGWQLGYYLYGVHMDFWWYPSLDWLAQTASTRAEHSQYVIVPSWEESGDMAAALAVQGLVMLPVHSALRPDGSVSFVTYRIAPGG